MIKNALFFALFVNILELSVVSCVNSVRTVCEKKMFDTFTVGFNLYLTENKDTEITIKKVS